MSKVIPKTLLKKERIDLLNFFWRNKMFLCRNLLSNDKQHIDHITNIYGKQLMQAVVFILESENNPEVSKLRYTGRKVGCDWT
jgi:hypothetical protein